MVDETLTRWLMTPGAADIGLRLEDVLRRPLWHAQAACRDEPVETFFPGRGDPVKPAKAICVGCPVRSECLEAALSDPTTAGVWGGTTGRERDRMLRSGRLREAS